MRKTFVPLFVMFFAGCGDPFGESVDMTVADFAHNREFGPPHDMRRPRDLPLRDLASEDQAVVADLSNAEDLTTVPDQMTPEDLSVSEDLSAPEQSDLSSADDLAAPDDFAVPEEDLSTPPDLVSVEDFATNPPDLISLPDLTILPDLTTRPDLLAYVLPNDQIFWTRLTREPADILVADGTTKYRISTPVFTASARQNVLVDRQRLTLLGDGASYKSITVTDGSSWNELRTPVGQNIEADVDIPNLFFIQAGHNLTTETYVQLEPVRSWNDVPNPTGVPRSGAIVGIGIASGDKPDWGVEYTNALNIRAWGVADYRTQYAPIVNMMSERFVVRAAKLAVFPMALNNNRLLVGDIEVAKFGVRVIAGSSGASKRFTFELMASHGPESTFELSNLRIRLNEREDLVTLTDCQGQPFIKTNWHESSDQPACVAVTFQSEVVHDQQAIVFSLRGLNMGQIRDGDSLVTHFMRSGAPPESTGSLTADGSVRLPDGSMIGGAIIWSDMSELPHNDFENGSVDWISDGLIAGMDAQWVLVR
ncbi:MAG: hypothetical protein Q7R83_00595 [bacterium]|nr:hypothetical protein [bacterium]